MLPAHLPTQGMLSCIDTCNIAFCKQELNIVNIAGNLHPHARIVTMLQG